MIRIDTNMQSVHEEEERILNERPMGCQHRVMLTREDGDMANQYIGDIYEYVSMSNGNVVSHDVILSVDAAKTAAVHVSVDLEDMDGNNDPHKAALDIAAGFMHDALNSIGVYLSLLNGKCVFDEEKFDIANICLVRVPMIPEVIESLKILRNS